MTDDGKLPAEARRSPQLKQQYRIIFFECRRSSILLHTLSFQKLCWLTNLCSNRLLCVSVDRQVYSFDLPKDALSSITIESNVMQHASASFTIEQQLCYAKTTENET
jgi:hypothetical protein